MKRAALVGAAIALHIDPYWLNPPKVVLNTQAKPDHLNRVSQKKRRQRQRWNNTK